MYVWSGKQILKYRFGSFACPLAALHGNACMVLPFWKHPASSRACARVVWNTVILNEGIPGRALAYARVKCVGGVILRHEIFFRTN